LTSVFTGASFFMRVGASIFTRAAGAKEKPVWPSRMTTPQEQAGGA
jgi:hypothetical protein